MDSVPHIVMPFWAKGWTGWTCDRATQLGCSVGWTGGSGHSQEYSLNFTLQGGKMMGHINIDYLLKHTLRKGVG